MTVNTAVTLDARFHGMLLRIDEELAAEARARGCPHCSGKLHSAQYPRRPRGWCSVVACPDLTGRVSRPGPRRVSPGQMHRG